MKFLKFLTSKMKNFVKFLMVFANLYFPIPSTFRLFEAKLIVSEITKFYHQNVNLKLWNQKRSNHVLLFTSGYKSHRSFSFKCFKLHFGFENIAFTFRLWWFTRSQNTTPCSKCALILKFSSMYFWLQLWPSQQKRMQIPSLHLTSFSPFDSLIWYFKSTNIKTTYTNKEMKIILFLRDIFKF